MPTVPNWLVVVLGLSIVFIGLICIIILCTIMSGVLKIAAKKDKAPAQSAAAPAAPVAAPAPIQNKQEILAAVCAAVAEELGTDVSGIKVLSFKRL